MWLKITLKSVGALVIAEIWDEAGFMSVEFASEAKALHFINQYYKGATITRV